MDHLWTPWRYRYVSKIEESSGCVFCEKASARNDEEDLIVFRGVRNFILLNLYPYTAGHLMVVPFDHVPSLEDASEETLTEMIHLARRAEIELRAVYRPQGLNIGLNVGDCAGAGVAGHIHMHVLPRWTGDSNFMTTIGETRVMPEDLSLTYEKLSRAFRRR